MKYKAQNTCTHVTHNERLVTHTHEHTTYVFSITGLSAPCLIHVPVFSGVTDL